MVEVGFTPPEVTKMLPSTMNRFFTSWQRPQPFTTERSGSVAHARGAEQMPAAVQDRALHADIRRAGGRQDLLRARDAVVHHAQRVLADRVIDLRRGDAVPILQHRIERDPVVLLRQVLADRRQADAAADQFAEGAVMALAPGQRGPSASLMIASVTGPMPRPNWKV